MTTLKLTLEDRKQDIQFLADWARDYSPIAEPAEGYRSNLSYEALLPQYLVYAAHVESKKE